MIINSKFENIELRRFEASRLWEFNVYGAVIGGIGGGILMCVVAGIILSDGIGLDQSSLIAVVLIGNVILGLLLLFPGNLVAQNPFAVELEEGKGLRIYAPLKKIYIPLDDVKEVRKSWLTLGWVVKLSRRHRLLKSFVIHGGFGHQGGELAHAIQEEIARRFTSGRQSASR